MFNLLVAYGADSWINGEYRFPKDRVAVEYTEDSISERYKDLQADVLHELKEAHHCFVSKVKTLLRVLVISLIFL